MAKIEYHDYTFDQDPSPQLDAGKLNIVFVDDEVDDVKARSLNPIMSFVNRVAGFLEQDNVSANLLVFNDPEVAQKFIAANAATLSLVISDNNMPGISGFDMIKGLRDQNVEVSAIIRSGLPMDVPRGVITTDKLTPPKKLYDDAIRPILTQQGHLAPIKMADVVSKVAANDAPLVPDTVYGAGAPLLTATKS